jgi:hypothetical protein
MMKNDNQGDLFSGFQPEKELSLNDICRIFNGKVITEEQYQEEIILLEAERRENSVDLLAMQLQRDGMLPDCEFPCSECIKKKGVCMFVQRIKEKHANLKKELGDNHDNEMIKRNEKFFLYEEFYEED